MALSAPITKTHGTPEEDPTLTNIQEAKAGRFFRVPTGHYNVLVVGAAFVGTVVLNGSFDGVNVHKVLDAGLGVDDATGNANIVNLVPFIQVEVTVYTSGRIDHVYIFGPL